MKILIISMLFQPDNSIGAVRPTNFAKWLAEFGHYVDVITINPESPKLSNNNLKVCYVSNGKYVNKFLNYMYSKIAEKNKSNSVQNNNKKQNQKKINQSPLRGVRTQLLEWIKSLDWRNECLKHLSKIFKQNQYDIVFSSYGPIGSYWLGRAIYKRRLSKYWVSDLRDLMVTERSPSWLNRIYGYFHNQMLKEANAVTVTSFGAAKILCNQYCRNQSQKNKVYIINNGYEINQMYIKTKSANDNILRICYTGSLYSGQRDMSLLFEALAALINDKKVDAEKIEVHYAGAESQELLSQAMPYHLECIIDHGFICREDALRLQNNSDIMVILSWNTQEEQGILTGKFFEYLAAEKPILSITCGDLPDAELSKMVREMNLGISCEYQSKTNDIELLKEYILNCYQCKKNGENIPFDPRKEMVAEYRYDNLTRKLENLFLNLLKE